MERTKTLEFFGDELPQDRKLRLGGERLLDAVAELPQRFAPFFGRLSALWQAPEELVIRELTRAQDPKSWSLSLLRGLKTFDVVLETATPGAHAHLLHFAPGLHFPKHRHRGPESVMVLEGAYRDANGIEVTAGETQSMPAGSEHELRIRRDAPCIAAVLEHGVKFDLFGFIGALRQRPSTTPASPSDGRRRPER